MRTPITLPDAAQPLVSVILPFLNGGAAFAAALQSIQWQTYQNWELLLCDDGSTDGSLETARSYRDARIKVWSDGCRKGLAARLNECIDRAQGELIARMDADDISYPERVRRQVEFLMANWEIDVVGCRMLIFGDDGTPLGKRPVPLEHERIVANPSLGFGLAHPTWMARANWYRQYRYDAAAIRFEDIELLYRAHAQSRFANLPELLYGYREMRGGFRKRLKTRVGRVQYLRARHGAMGLGLLVKAAIAEALKAGSDALLALTGTRYAMLKFREERLTAQDLQVWNHVLTAGGVKP
jgi:glycosyltransferase involved in cell wall biosynthesis